MKNTKASIIWLILINMMLFQTQAPAQILKKIKDKVQAKVENAAGLGDTKKESQQGLSNSSSSNTKNKVGGGLKSTTPPDVIAEMQEAEKAHTASKYSDARYSLQQALVGVEIQIGHQVLSSLPATINDLSKDTTKNVVMSTQWGWNNLTIQTMYRKDPDKEMTISIGNNTIYGGLAAMYFSNAGYVQANNKEQNIKQTRVKGNKAIIEYDDSKGYTLIMPLGQTSLIVWECVNFATEDEVMNAANKFDIDGIKKMLGEK